jgi:hypothetical protein
LKIKSRKSSRKSPRCPSESGPRNGRASPACELTFAYPSGGFAKERSQRAGPKRNLFEDGRFREVTAA